MNNILNSKILHRARRVTHGFSLVEVMLAIAVVAIGLVGILGLFPLGMDAVRQSADATQMMAIGQDYIAYYQQYAIDSNSYYTLPSEVIPSTSYSTNQSVDGIWYRIKVVVTNGVTPIRFGGTNMLSRVEIGVYRTTGSASTTPVTSTNYYFTEVARYVQ